VATTRAPMDEFDPLTVEPPPPPTVMVWVAEIVNAEL
jgi:hypothetical protein